MYEISLSLFHSLFLYQAFLAHTSFQIQPYSYPTHQYMHHSFKRSGFPLSTSLKHRYAGYTYPSICRAAVHFCWWLSSSFNPDTKAMRYPWIFHPYLHTLLFQHYYQHFYTKFNLFRNQDSSFYPNGSNPSSPFSKQKQRMSPT